MGTVNDHSNNEMNEVYGKNSDNQNMYPVFQDDKIKVFDEKIIVVDIGNVISINDFFMLAVVSKVVKNV